MWENFETPTTIMTSGGSNYKIIDVPTIFGEQLGKFPVTLRILMENIARNTSGDDLCMLITALHDWFKKGVVTTEIPFYANRVLMHDTTSTPALVDVAAMRATLSEEGFNPSLLNPVIPVEISVDHSLSVEVYGRADARQINLNFEMERNKERYRFLRWASQQLENVSINPPGTGIMHTINLEQLASVVHEEQKGGELWAIPDVMLGTDSHTTMINGIGVLGWGIGGLEALNVMFGLPSMIRLPKIVGVKLHGELSGSAQSTDLALKVTQKLREVGVTGEFVEFFGPGVSSLTAMDRAVVANMAPEYGATTGFFPVDQQTLDYLDMTGRENTKIDLVETYSKTNGFWFQPGDCPQYSRTIEINLTEIGILVSGPCRPQDMMKVIKVPEVLKKTRGKKQCSTEFFEYPVALAAITSCTNTTDPRLLITAGLVAKKAREYKLEVPSWVKTSLAPGSPSAKVYLHRAGLLDDLSAIGFDIVGYGCTTCIGNSGHLPDAIVRAKKINGIKPVAILSGNRNFPGRVHPDIELAFIMSPALVIIYALTGNAGHILNEHAIQTDQHGAEVFLDDLWPCRDEIEKYTIKALDKNDFKREFKTAGQNPLWSSIEVPNSPLYPWDEQSTTLRRPPFATSSKQTKLGEYRAFPLAIFGDDVTTDHISPASAIPDDSFIAQYLVDQGERQDNLNVFASRRGNWEVMMRATFYNKSLKNKLAPESPVGHTLHIPSGEVLPFWLAAKRYQEDNQSVVLIAGERFGMGSSRDWAAKGQYLLGIRAVLARSFERIHRSNLIGMGILPLIIEGNIKISPTDRIAIDVRSHTLSPSCKVSVQILHSKVSCSQIRAKAAIETALEIELLESGGIIPYTMDIIKTRK